MRFVRGLSDPELVYAVSTSLYAVTMAFAHAWAWSDFTTGVAPEYVRGPAGHQSGMCILAAVPVASSLFPDGDTVKLNAR